MCVLKSVKIHLKILGCMPLGIDAIHLPYLRAKIPFDLAHVTCVFTLLIGNMVATFCFYIPRVKTLGDFSESVFWGSRSVLSLVLYTMLICRKPRLIQFFDRLDEIASTRNQNIMLREIYVAADRRSVIMQRNISFYTFVVVPILYVIPIAYKSYYAYFIVDSTSVAFQLFYHVALPFDWRTPITYVLAAAIQLLFFLGVLEIFVAFLVIYFGICHFLVALVADIEQSFAYFRQDAIKGYNKVSTDRQIELYRSLRKIIEFHSNAIQIVSSFSKFYKPFMSMCFAISTSYLSIFCLRIQSDFDAGDHLNVFRSMIRMSGWIFGFYYICKFGDEVTSRFQNVAHSIYACPWHVMPSKMTKHFPMLIAMAQQPIYLYGSFNIRCIRETFQKMVSAAFSYFTVLREII